MGQELHVLAHHGSYSAAISSNARVLIAVSELDVATRSARASAGLPFAEMGA